jgi:hypothetical protein
METNYEEVVFTIIIFYVLTTFCTKGVTSFRIADEYPEEGNGIFLQNADTNLPDTLSHIP